MDLSRLVTSGSRGPDAAPERHEDKSHRQHQLGSLLRGCSSILHAEERQREHETGLNIGERNIAERKSMEKDTMLGRADRVSRMETSIENRAYFMPKLEGHTEETEEEAAAVEVRKSRKSRVDDEVESRAIDAYGQFAARHSVPSTEDSEGRAKLSRSVESDPSAERPFYCKRCLSAFSSKSNLQVHNRTVHDRQRPYVCEQCNYRFGTKSNRNRHERMVHRNERTYECPHCDKTFGTRSCVRRHCRKIHGEAPTTP
eukprot:Plantae.Rhodophyta-Purpureofilum_apyrenoidigerum.ctg608.p1 GENE.Plantae.Rhodophyta-Purpureofilum_apyrenoidigerum.ctg608~~Plantae.Rhodophyta-Purpureofilum_apyrenoidigerum.ctg608.p1  ORF type:complete len:257 (+),score=29.96 Plantae.Rhodophyta-Purpureofilum_apyrenoidigerum.ctg608:1547-2317(+)